MSTSDQPMTAAPTEPAGIVEGVNRRAEVMRLRAERRRARREALRGGDGQEMAFGPRDKRIAVALASGRRVLFIKRVSGTDQVSSSTGGNDEQTDQILNLAPYGISTEDHPQVEVIDVPGQSASWRARRPHMQRIFRELESGAYGIVLVRDADRLTRNAEDSGRLIGLFQRHRVLLCVGGRALDARDKIEEDSIKSQFRHAEWQSSHTYEVSVKARYKDAGHADVLLRPCTGIIAADPNDPQYLARLREAGLEEFVHPDMIGRHIEAFIYDGRIHHYLPYPDQEVAQAVRFCLREIRRLGSVAKLVDAIRAGAPGYPRPGHLPIIEHAVFNHECKVSWVPVTTRQVRRWLGSGFLYGEYRHSAQALRDITDLRTAPPEDVFIPDCFPSFGTAEDATEVRAILARRSRAGRTDRPDGRADAHGIPRLVCQHPLSDGRPCGRAIGPLDPQPHVAPFAYIGLSCATLHGHDAGAFPHVEGVVLEVVLEAFTTERVEEAVRAIKLEVKSGAGRALARLEKALREQKDLLAGARALQALAQTRGDLEAVRDHETTCTAAHARIAEMTKERERLARAADHSDAWEAEDVARLPSLASDLPRLIERAREADRAVADRIRAGAERASVALQEGRLRALLRALVAEVRLTPVEDLELDITVVFLGGGEVTRRAHVGYFMHAQAAGVYAAGRVAQGIPPEAVAAEINAVLPDTPQGYREEPWTPGRVRVSVGLYAWPEVRRRATALGAAAAACTVEQISTDTGEPLEAVQRAALTGQLGLARWDGERFLLEAAPADRARAFPEYARRTVAQQQGWPVEDTALLATLAPADTTYSRLLVAARAGAGIAQDDAGRNWTRRAMFALDRAGQLRIAVQRDYPALLTPDLAGWHTLKDALHVTGRGAQHLCRYYPTIRLGKVGHTKAGATYVYCTPEAQRTVATRVLGEAIDALNERAKSEAARRGETAPEPFRPEDFVDLSTLADSWRRIGGPSRPSLERRVGDGTLTTVKAFGPAGTGKFVRYIHVPAHIRAAQGPGALYEWLGMQPPGRYKRHRRSTPASTQ